MNSMKRTTLVEMKALSALVLTLGVSVSMTGATLSSTEVRAKASALPEVVMTDVSMPLFRAVKAVHNRKQSFPWGVPQVEQLRPGLLGDDQLDDVERRLLAEFQKPFFHVRLVALKSPIFKPEDLVLAGTFTDDARAELAKFAPMEGREQLALWLDSSTVGWTKLVAYARQSDEQREEVLDVLVAVLKDAAQRSNSENRYEPFRERLDRLHNAAGMQKGADNAFARITLLRTAANLVYDSGRGGIPSFMLNGIRRSADEAVFHDIEPGVVSVLRELQETRPFPWGSAEAVRAVEALELLGERESSARLLLQVWQRPKFQLHLVARTPSSEQFDVMDLDGSFSAEGMAILKEAAAKWTARDPSAKK
jgi:hypothetical protein